MSEETNSVEQQAIELGWQPKEQFEADPKNEGKRWRTAEDFMDRQPLFEKIDSQGRELKELKRALQSLADQNKKVEELAYKRAIEDLKAQKVKALEEDDHAKVVEIDEQIADLKSSPPKKEEVPQNEAFVRWVEKNDWYVKDKNMRSVADGIGLSLAREGHNPDEIFTIVETRIKEIYPDKFGRTRVPPNPESGGSRKGNGSVNVESLLTPMEQRVMNTIVATGVSKEDYLKQFVEIQPERFKGVKL
jgi:hypothetical protein